MTLLADVNCPGSQEEIVSIWEPAHSLVEDAVSEAKTAAAPCPLTLAVTHLPLWLWGGEGPKQQLAFSPCFLGHNPLFCEHARGHHMALEPFMGKVLLFVLFCFCLIGNPKVWVAMSH